MPDQMLYCGKELYGSCAALYSSAWRRQSHQQEMWSVGACVLPLRRGLWQCQGRHGGCQALQNEAVSPSNQCLHWRDDMHSDPSKNYHSKHLFWTLYTVSSLSRAPVCTSTCLRPAMSHHYFKTKYWSRSEHVLKSGLKSSRVPPKLVSF